MTLADKGNKAKWKFTKGPNPSPLFYQPKRALVVGRAEALASYVGRQRGERNYFHMSLLARMRDHRSCFAHRQSCVVEPLASPVEGLRGGGGDGVEGWEGGVSDLNLRPWRELLFDRVNSTDLHGPTVQVTGRQLQGSLNSIRGYWASSALPPACWTVTQRQRKVPDYSLN